MTIDTRPLHLEVRPDWLASRSEPVLDPDREIVDAHHHLWDRPGSRYLLPDLIEDVGDGHRVIQTIFVQCRSMYRADGPEPLRPIGEVEFANGVAAMSASGLYGASRACAAIVGLADLTLGTEVSPVLDALRQAGNGRLRGIRFPVAFHPDDAVRSTPAVSPPGLMAAPAFRAGAAALARAGLSLDLWAYHTQLAEVSALAAAVPDLTLVIDHCGGPIGVGPYRGRRQAAFAEWSAAMRDLARRPNVVVKLGGLAMGVGGFDFHLNPEPPSSEQLAAAWRPYIETCLALFGAERCMFESNFPVDKGMLGYRVLWNGFKRLSTDLSETEKRALFAGTARRVYRLDGGKA